MPLALHKTGTPPRRELHPARGTIFLALLAVHSLAVLYLASLRGPVPDIPAEGFATTVFFVDRTAERHVPQVTKLRPRSTLAPTLTDTMPRGPLLSDAPAPSQQEETSAPAAIDWGKEAERVAADPALKVDAAPAPAAHQQFAWDYAHTHRVESLPEGGLVVNLSDRCSIVVRFPMILGACKIGKIEGRGDLFVHMRDK
jgi:hypothetical protein